jgi:D-beta-D-heptose 7-phosphate kinase/D-beta-D-heptose 1-phosphate adenosyltransferase
MLIKFDDIAAICKQLRNEGKKIVFTNGCFDIIHAGHTVYLKEAKRLGDVLVIGLNSDDSVRRLKGEERPLNTEIDRAEVLLSLKPVDYVVVFTDDTPFELIKRVQPDVLVKGGDYKKENIVGADIVEAGGGEVAVIPFVEGKSTSSLVEKIKKL